MAVLRDDADRPERRRRAQDRTHVVRIGHLIEDQKHRPFRRVRQKLVEPGVLQRLDFDHHALVRGVRRNEATEVRRLGDGHRDVLRELHELRRLACRPGAQHLAVGIVERRRNRVLAPEARAVGRAMALMRLFALRHLGVRHQFAAHQPWQEPLVRRAKVG